MQPLFEIKIFWPATTDFLLKCSPPISEDEMQMSWQLAPKQITNVQNTTAWPQNSAKTFIKRPISMT